MAALLCIVAFAVTFLCGRRSLGNGLIAMFAFGYGYGIVRANLPAEASHFIFDTAVLGLYAAVFSKSPTRAARNRSVPLQPWVAVLMGWPLLMFFVPIQDWLIQFVGLRGAVFFVPFLLIGARMEQSDFVKLATGIAVLNIVELAVGASEFFFGIENFYPHNAVTDLIYKSNNGAAGANRMPGTFVQAAAYGGMVALTVPFLAGAWAQPSGKMLRRRLLEVGLFASGCGIFLSGSRTSALLFFCLVAGVFTSLRLKMSHRIALGVLVVAVLWVTTKDSRLQRFTTLSDTDFVKERIGWSVNASFTDALLQYPMGNGLGGGGTSIPYFLADRVRDPVLIENEYARILIEQGVVGLIVWLAFILWLLIRAWPKKRNQWYVARLLLWGAVAFSFLGAPLGTGLLTAIPMTALLMLASGWLIACNGEQQSVKAPALRYRFRSGVNLPFGPGAEITSPAP
jgi:hypothetical protein